MNQAVVLAAGSGKRLKPITDSRSKAMLPILGKPIVARVLENLLVNDVNNILIVVSPDDLEIGDYFRDGRYLGARVRLVQQPQPLGTANALHLSAPHIKDDFILTACDSLFNPADIERMITYWDDQRDLDGLLALRKVGPDAIANSGIVELDGESVIRIVEKPTLKDAPSDIASLPIYCFTPRLLSYLSEVEASHRGEYELQDAFQKLIDQSGQVGWIHVENRLNLTNPADLLSINMHFLHREPDMSDIETDVVGSRTHFIPPVKIEQGARIGKGCTIGPNVFVEQDCVISDQVVLRDSVILRGAFVAKGVNVANELLR